MRSLFLKIFLWFWLAQLLISVVMFTVTEATRTERGNDRWRSTTNYALSLYARAAAAAYETGGAKALAANLQQAKGDPRTRTRTFVFDESGNEVLGRSFPGAARTLAARAAQSDEAEFTFSNDYMLSARAARSPGGKQFVLVSQMPRRQRRPPGLLGDLLNPTGQGGIRLLFLFFTSGLVCYGLARYLTSPAVKLRRATHQLAGGDLSARVGAQMGRRRDELADLGRDFDQMAERIETLIQSERRLLGDISHELRSPLARLTVALDLADQNADPETAGFLNRIRRESERLNALIGQLMALSRLESGTAKVEHTLVNLAALVDDIARDADFEASSRNSAVKVIRSEECWTHGAPELLRSAVENVVRNAVLYTVEGSTVELSLGCKEKTGATGEAQAVISVHDHGPGVPEETLSQLFRPFYRVADARDRQSGGVGLGLAITARAVRFHGGDVTASNAAGGGLLVEISLPVAEPLKR